MWVPETKYKFLEQESWCVCGGGGSYLRTYVYIGSQVILFIICFVFHELIALNAYQFTMLGSLMVLIAWWDYGAQWSYGV